MGGSGLVKETSRNQCYYPTYNAGYTCGHRQTNYISLCPCGDPPGVPPTPPPKPKPQPKAKTKAKSKAKPAPKMSCENKCLTKGGKGRAPRVKNGWCDKVICAACDQCAEGYTPPPKAKKCVKKCYGKKSGKIRNKMCKKKGCAGCAEC